MAASCADFFYHPLYQFYMSDPQEIADVILFLIVAAVTGNVAANLRTEFEKITPARSRSPGTLCLSSRRLAWLRQHAADLYSVIQDFLSNHLGRRSELIGAGN